MLNLRHVPNRPNLPSVLTNDELSSLDISPLPALSGPIREQLVYVLHEVLHQLVSYNDLIYCLAIRPSKIRHLKLHFINFLI